MQDVFYEFIHTSLLPKLIELTPIVLSYWTIVQFIMWKKLLLCWSTFIVPPTLFTRLYAQLKTCFQKWNQAWRP